MSTFEWQKLAIGCNGAEFVVDRRAMLDQAAILRLMTGLIGTIYLLLAFLRARSTGISRALLPVTAAAAVIVALWVFAPAVLETGQIELPFQVRQLGLLLGGVAIVGAYIGMRPASQTRLPNVIARLTTALLAAGLTLSSANWLVAVGLAVVSAIELFRRVGASPGGSFERSPRPPVDE